MFTYDLPPYAQYFSTIFSTPIEESVALINRERWSALQEPKVGKNKYEYIAKAIVDAYHESIVLDRGIEERENEHHDK